MPKTSNVEIVTAAEVIHADLRSSADRINQSIELIKGHENAFEDATLEHRLIIGLEIAKAQQAFGIDPQQRARLGGEAKAALPTVGKAEKPAVLTSNPLGFSNWIKTEIPDLPRSTAQRYATAFNALGLSTEEANTSLIRKRIKDFRHLAGKANEPMPTLATFYKMGRPAPSKEPLKIDGPKDTPKMRLEDAREAFHVWKEKFDQMLTRGQLDDLDRAGLEDLKEFLLSARDRVNKRLR